ncbi:amidohydrolase [Ferdinandcohnia quinoae]|uniref:Amidohydrolase n=1 Tax=Fredinandcohnia quinoae TaxID=2918902 RepID=A0AAW5E3S3_9BACI|nr:amidohydrolase [Fredinandcohnia sp. SECRCQ15]MCH1627587.1 amidohydrolase [Fredinandcohnia sp. SECRCQ15]
MGTLYKNGKIYTMVHENEFVDCILVKNGIIAAIGTEAEISDQFLNDIDATIDLLGHTMFPGFVDSHMHVIGHGEKIMQVDLSEMTSSQQIRKAVKDRVDVAGDCEWIIGEGWNENELVDKKIFHKNELDEISPNNPLVLKRICRHALVANSKALELAGITNVTHNPPGGVIVRDNDGVATGYLLDQAQELVKSVIPEVSEDYLERALTVSINDCLSLGLVGCHTEDLNYYGGFQRTYHTFQKVINEKSIKFRANLLVHYEVVDDMHDLGHHFQSGNEFIEIGAMKIFADGALGGRTALLSHPYNDSPETSGVAIHSLRELKNIVKKARKYEMPVAIHVIGDLAFEYAVKAIEEYPPLKGQRDRLIHAQILRRELIDRAKKLPIILDIQPRFVATDFPWVIERIGESRMEYCYAWKTLLKEGFHCAGGSDAPIEPVDPLLGIHAAVTRKNPNDVLNRVYMPNERLSVYEAIQLFTSGSAYATGKENQQGKILPGYVADFTILDRDLLIIPHDEILKAKVVMTIVDNEIMYTREEQ